MVGPGEHVTSFLQLLHLKEHKLLPTFRVNPKDMGPGPEQGL